MIPENMSEAQRAEINETTMEVSHHIVAVVESLDIVLEAVIGCRTKAIAAGFSEMAAEVMATNFYQTMLARMFN